MEEQSKKKEAELNILDVFYYLLRYWKWYVVATVVYVGLAYLRYARLENVYSSTTMVYIKDATSGKPWISSSAVGLDKFRNNINKTDISNEKLKLKSKYLIREVVKKLQVDVSYKVKDGFHFDELVKRSPIIAS